MFCPTCDAKYTIETNPNYGFERRLLRVQVLCECSGYVKEYYISRFEGITHMSVDCEHLHETHQIEIRDRANNVHLYLNNCRCVHFNAQFVCLESENKADV